MSYKYPETARTMQEVTDLIKRVETILKDKIPKGSTKLSDVKELSETDLIDLLKLKSIHWGYEKGTRDQYAGFDRMQAEVGKYVNSIDFLQKLNVDELTDRLIKLKTGERDRPRPPGGP